MNTLDVLLAIAGLVCATVLTRAAFLLPRQELPMPPLVRRALKYAPLAALVAIVVPEIVMTQGQLVATWADARVLAALAAGGYFWWRRGILGTIFTGMLVFVPLRLGLGW